jgi:iron complex outermembrane receptor protein
MPDVLPDDVDRIEVISGPGATLWGANAVNGVINIITKGAKDSQGTYAEAGGGSLLRGLAGVRYGGTLARDVFVRVYGKSTGYDDERLPDGRDASDSWRMNQAGFRIDATRSSQDAFTIQGDIQDGREDLGTGGTARLGGGNLLGRWSREFSEQSDLSLQVYYDRTHLALPVPALTLSALTLAPAGTLIDDLDTFDVDLQHRLPRRGRHGITWGLGYRFTHDAVQNAPALGFEPPVLNQRLYSGFVQDEIALASGLSFTAGTKIEHNDYTGVEAEPSARLQWTMSPTRRAWTAVSRAVRMPARVDRDERIGTPALSPFVDNLLVGGADFRSETLLAYEAGYRARLGRKASGSIAVFFNSYDHLRSTSLGEPDPVLGLPFPLFFENNLEGDTHGVELSASYDVLDAWRLNGGYTFLSEDIRVKPGQSDFNNALNETADPPHRLQLRSSMDLPGRTGLDLALRWVDAFRYSDSGTPATVPSYAELGGRLAWFPVPSVELSLAGRNLLHDQHLEYVISSPNPREEITRSIDLKVAVRW